MANGLLDPTAVRELASRLGLRPAKQRGQSFVTDANTVRRIVAAAQVAEDDIVLEVGPGLGSLTLGLLQAANRVIAIEIDDLLAAQLPKTVAARLPDRVTALRVINADALRVDAVPEPPT
ncbi:MAG TPA: rRNA adenine N-6-methyltransferase family protein, partial [Propionibacteriaceae bacterium]|nr:rRNA adenine N-6-methyltransferase family protein [Propionibacteriaceae bacterium]